MSLRLKTLLIVGITLVGLILGVYIISQTILLRSYVQLEQQNVTRNVQRVLNAVNDEISVLHSANIDWSHWNDTYQFMDDRNTAYLDANTQDGSFISYELNFMVYRAADGKIVFSKGFDLNQNKEAPLPAGLEPFLQSDSPLVNFPATESGMGGIGGLIMLPGGPLMVASTPIYPTDLNQPPRGVLIWGRLLDARKIKDIAERTQLSLEIAPLSNLSGRPDFVSAQQLVTADNPIPVLALSNDTAAGYAVLKDVTDQPILMLRADVPRSIYQQGLTSLSYFLILMVLLGGAAIVVTLFLLERTVLSRLAFLTSSVAKIETDTEHLPHIEMKGEDELSQLTTSINSMLDAIAHAQDAMRLARDEAVEASAFKTQILANVSHDARTPLTVISLRTEMLQRGLYGPLTDTQQKILESISTNSGQLLSFINNLLHEGQLKSAKIQLSSVAFTPADLLNTLENSMQPLAANKSLAFRTELGADVPAKLCGDPERLNQILFNLVGNAIKFTDKGSVQASIRRADRDHWQIRVEDTGIGIPPEAQKRVFEAFWQVDGSSTRTVTSGVGLGLSIVKQLTDLMGGSITLDSQLGVGTVFTVTLPIVEPKEETHVQAVGLHR
jgi:signal transduction histidine kinase